MCRLTNSDRRTGRSSPRVGRLLTGERESIERIEAVVVQRRRVALETDGPEPGGDFVFRCSSLDGVWQRNRLVTVPAHEGTVPQQYLLLRSTKAEILHSPRQLGGLALLCCSEFCKAHKTVKAPRRITARKTTGEIHARVPARRRSSSSLRCLRSASCSRFSCTKYARAGRLVHRQTTPWLPEAAPHSYLFDFSFRISSLEQQTAAAANNSRRIQQSERKCRSQRRLTQASSPRCLAFFASSDIRRYARGTNDKPNGDRNNTRVNGGNRSTRRVRSSSASPRGVSVADG